MSELKPCLDFGDYVNIEQHRYGSDNEIYLHKVVGRIKSNAWVDVPVKIPRVNSLHYGELEDVVLCICCGVDGTEVFKYRISDVELVDTRPQNDGLWEEIESSLEIYSDLTLDEIRKSKPIQRDIKAIQSPSNPQAVPKPSLVECVEKRICKFCRYWDEVEYCGKHDSETVGQDYCSYFTENQIRPKQLAEELER